MFGWADRAVARWYVNQGDRQIEAGDESKAQKKYESALARDEASSDAHARLAKIALERKEFEDAATHYRAALKLDSDNIEYAMNLGESLGELSMTSMDRPKHLLAAARAFQHAREIDPRNFTAALRLGQCYRCLGEDQAAIAVLEEAVNLDPVSSDVHLELASIHEARGDHREALAHYQKVLKLDPNDVSAHNRAAAVNFELARTGGARGLLAKQRAMAHLKRSLEINPNQPRLRDVAGVPNVEQTQIIASGEPDAQ
jgi:tetratricopeptide (TPR) repeat protein